MTAWMDVLDRMEESLRQSLSLAKDFHEAPRQEAREPHDTLAPLDARLRQWQASLDNARRDAAAADEALAAEHAALLACRERLGNAIESLGRWLA